MEGIAEIFIMILYGLVEGVTEWLPISSTGHLLILEKLIPLPLSPESLSAFRVFVQLAAVLAVIVLYWKQLWPWTVKGEIGKEHRKNTWKLWLYMVIATIPAGIVGYLVDDYIEEHFYHPIPVALALIFVAFLFLFVENKIRGREPRYHEMEELSWSLALIIGCAQVGAAVFPGVSRSGSCILAALILGIARPLAAEFSFLLAVPVMFGASFLKLIRLEIAPSTSEILYMLIGAAVAFLVSILTMRFLIGFVRRHEFKCFAFYRIALGVIIILMTLLQPALLG